jgi:hypothetical protein
MDLSQVTIAGKQVIIAPSSVRASSFEGGIFLSVGYTTEKERGAIRFRLPRGARLILNEPWYDHAWWRPRDISKATVAIFELGGTRYTLVREYVG